MNIFYVYEHWRPDKNTCFYVGKGKGKRAYLLQRDNRYYARVVNKLVRLGLTVEVKIVEEGLSEDAAFKLEKYYIEVWRNKGAGLTNKSDGGDGPAGYKFTLEQRKSLSEAHLGKKQSRESVEKRIAPLRGRKLRSRTPEEIEAMRTKLIGRKNGPHSKKTKANISAALKGKKRGPHTEAHCEAISKGNTGKRLSKMHRKNISLAKTGVPQGPHTAQHNAKIGMALRGRKDSPDVCARKKLAAKRRAPSTKETRAKISETMSQLWAANSEYRERMSEAGKNRSPISRKTRAKMRAAQRRRRSRIKVSAQTRARASLSMTEWHARRAALIEG